MHGFFRNRHDKINLLLRDDAPQVGQIGLLVFRRRRHAMALCHGAGSARQMALERFRHHHAPAKISKAARHIQRLGQTPECQQHIARHAARVTRHITCRAGRVVSRAAGRTSPGASMWKSKWRNSRAISSTASTCAKAAPAQTRGPMPKGI